jgi:type I restriction-modification system DNA methylase subunit
LIEGKKPDKIREMRFADIACGSGSFLLGVYDLLLRHHTAYYNANKQTRKEGIKAGCREHDDGTLHLSLWQRREILVNNIYGVDIDAQAVEVAQLSLYLKMLEDETTASAKKAQFELSEYEARQALLPSLSKNIIYGNSLIGWDILEGKLFETEEEKKLNPMNFKDAFPLIINSGGFDAIVGNPPWGASLTEVELEYLRKANQEVIVRMIDSFMYFVHKGCKLIKPDGHFGMILPDVILYQKDNHKLREFLLKGFALSKILNMGDVFEKVIRPASILIIEKREPTNNRVEIGDLTKFKKSDKPVMLLDTRLFQEVAQEEFQAMPNSMFATSGLGRYSILTRLITVPPEVWTHFIKQAPG